MSALIYSHISMTPDEYNQFDDLIWLKLNAVGITRITGTTMILHHTFSDGSFITFNDSDDRITIYSVSTETSFIIDKES